jgi:hypothetical protein
MMADWQCVLCSEGLETMSEFFQKWQRSSFVFLKDLDLLASLSLAQFMVWRFLRRRRQENAARRKNFMLVRGRAFLNQAESYRENHMDCHLRQSCAVHEPLIVVVTRETKPWT